jgi:hypothetical protein
MFGLFDFKVTGFQAMQGPVGLAYALRNVYDPDETRQIKISIEEYEEQDDNNDCGN